MCFVGGDKSKKKKVKIKTGNKGMIDTNTDIWH